MLGISFSINWRKYARILLWICAVFGVWLGVGLFAGAAFLVRDLPSVDDLHIPNRPISVQFIDRYGRDILVRGANASRPVTVKALPAHVSAAILAIEDRRFYSHVGVDPLGIARAALANFRAGETVQGGSTLTQQLTKNVFLSPEQTLKRKGQEILLSLWLEQKLTKPEILSLYLNRVYFGSAIWGVSAASQIYFAKAPETLNLTEAALLAGLLKAPSTYTPYASTKRAARRTAVVLGAMEDAGYISKTEQRAALLAPIRVFRTKDTESANYFVNWIWKHMVAEIGVPRTDLLVQTTLDIDAQRAAQTAVQTHLDPDRNARQAALISLDGDGAVRAMIGGASYKENQFNRAVQARRQPGSAFKPFVYLAAFEAGFRPSDLWIDAPLDLDGWSPRNFNKTHQGEMALDVAFAKSVNTIAVSLAEEVGRDKVIATAARLGLPDLKPLRSLALGAQEVSPLQLAGSYLPFANWGETGDVFGILSISTANGTPLYESKPAEMETVISLENLQHIDHVMRKTVREGTGSRAAISGYEVGGKTGTTNDFRDAWFVGYVPDKVTAVWIGNDESRFMRGVTGGSLPAMIWRDYMQEVLPETSLKASGVGETVESLKRADTLGTLLNRVEESLSETP